MGLDAKGFFWLLNLPNSVIFLKIELIYSSLAAAGAVLADVWVEGVTMPVVDGLGEEFLNYVKDGMKITVKPDGIVEVE